MNRNTTLQRNTLEDNAGFSFRKAEVIAIWFLVGSVPFIYHYSGIKFAGYTSQCIFNRATGMLCAGCGGTRAVDSLLSGHIYQSLRYNFIPLLLGETFLLAWMQYTMSTFNFTRVRIFRYGHWMLWTFAFILVFYWVSRNII